VLHKLRKKKKSLKKPFKRGVKKRLGVSQAESGSIAVRRNQGQSPSFNHLRY